VAKKKEHITRRIMRSLFGKKKEEKEEEEAEKPRDLNASLVICPEMIASQNGKKAPKSTARKAALSEPVERIKIYPLPWDIVHVVFLQAREETDDTLVTRDPVTRRLSRKKLNDGMKRTTGFYDKQGDLFDEKHASW